MTTIFVTFRVEGWHRWPSAPDLRAYLSQAHRHMFHFRVEVEVFQDDREIELHNLRDLSLQLLRAEYSPSVLSSSQGLNFGSDSCETISRRLLFQLAKAPNIVSPMARWMACEVSEDGECGACIERWTRHNEKAL